MNPALPLLADAAYGIAFLLVSALFLAGLPFVWLSSWLRKRRQRKADEAAAVMRRRRRMRAEEELSRARAAGTIEPVSDPVPVMLEAGEGAYWCEQTTLSETRTERSFSGFTTDWQALDAFSIGSVHAKEKTKDVVKKIDDGHLVFTNRRLLFVGAVEQRSFPIGKIVSLQGSPAALAVGADGAAKRMFFTSRNGLLAEWTAKNLAKAARG